MGKKTDRDPSINLDADESPGILKRQNQRLSFLYDISLTANRSLDLIEILDDSLKKIIDFMEADSGVIYIINDLTQELLPMSFVNLSDAAVEDLSTNKVMIGECVCGKIAECDEEIIIYEKASSDPRFTRETIRNEGMEFYAGLPLNAKGKVIGVICVITHIPYRPDNELIEILRAATVPLSLAIDNARIFRTETSKADLIVRHDEFQGIISVSEKMKAVLDLVRKVKDLPTSILIYGESGTGKELIARAIHYNSTRKDAPFIAINCAAIPETLLESEFFGYVKGAFTNAHCDRKGLFESADGGTVFLDEIDTMSPGLQAKLLRVLQDGTFTKIGCNTPATVNIRVIAATNRDLKASIEANTFREDLFYRLNVINMDIPPLRERIEDIPVLVKTFIHEISSAMGRSPVGIQDKALEILMAHHWQGNVRELRNTVERALAISDGPLLTVDDLPREMCPQGDSAQQDLSLKKAEMEHIQHVMRLVQGNKKKAAQLLGINASTLWRKLNSKTP